MVKKKYISISHKYIRVTLNSFMDDIWGGGGKMMEEFKRKIQSKADQWKTIKDFCS